MAIVALFTVVALGWLMFLRLPSVPLALAPRVPSCVLDGDRPFTTETLTLCIPPDAAMTTTPSSDMHMNVVSIPGIAEGIVIVTGPFLLMDESTKLIGAPIMDRIEEKPVVRNASYCRQFRVVEARWKRKADGWRARMIASTWVTAGYGWSPPNEAEALDRILDTTHCETPGMSNAG